MAVSSSEFSTAVLFKIENITLEAVRLFLESFCVVQFSSLFLIWHRLVSNLFFENDAVQLGCEHSQQPM